MADPFPIAKVAVNSEIQRATSPDLCPVVGCTVVVVRVDLTCVCSILPVRPPSSRPSGRFFLVFILCSHRDAQSSFLKIRCRKPLRVRRRGWLRLGPSRFRGSGLETGTTLVECAELAGLVELDLPENALCVTTRTRSAGIGTRARRAARRADACRS